MAYTDRPDAGQQGHCAHDSATPPAGCIDPDRIAPTVASDPRWYGFRWNGKSTPPTYFHFPSADEVTLDPGDPVAIIPAPGKGSSFDVTHAALLDGANLDGIAMLAPGAKRPELFNSRDSWILWTKESTATQQEKIALLDALGCYDEEPRVILIDHGMLPKPPAGNGQDHHATALHQGDDAEPPAFRLTDTGNAERFAHQHRQQVCYCWEWSTWLAWDGTRWRTDSGALVQALAKQTVRRIYAEAAHTATEEHARAIAKHAMRSESSKARRDFLDLARSEDGIPIAAAALDRAPWLLNCVNGTVDLQTGELRQHDPTDLLTKRTEIEFDPTATAPLWLAFLDRILAGDQALISFLQRAIGYSLTATTREQCFLILHGSGSNGKSTLLDVLLTLLGQDYGIHCDAELLLAKRHETHTTERADLAGVRLVTVIETGDGRRLAENFIKQMTGGDRIRARRMRQDSFEFMPQFKLWLATNHRPEIRGTDYAIWRRIRLIPFEVAIPDSEKDPTLPEKLKVELPGILAWAVQGCLEWQRIGLQPPDKVTAATQAYKEDMDVLAAFLADCCVIRPTARAQAASLYDAYTRWCEQNGERAETQRKFGQRLTERGFQKSRSGPGYFYEGIRLQAIGYEEGAV